MELKEAVKVVEEIIKGKEMEIARVG